MAGMLMVLCSAPAVVGAVSQHAEPLPGWALQIARIELGHGPLDGRQLEPHRRCCSTTCWAGCCWCVAILLGAARLDRGAVLALFAAVARALRRRLRLHRRDAARADQHAGGPAPAAARAPGSSTCSGWSTWPTPEDAWASARVPRLLMLVLLGAMLVSPSDFVPLEPIWVGSDAAVGRRAGRRTAGGPSRRRTARPGAVGAGLLERSRGGGGAAGHRRCWQFDLDDGVKAAAMAGVLVLGWLRRRDPARRAIPRSAGLRGLGRWRSWAPSCVRGSTDWLYQLRHRGGLASAAAFQEWARTQTPVDSVFLILPSEPNNDTSTKRRPGAVPGSRARESGRLLPQHNLEFRDRRSRLA